jgi:cytochrome c-type biogenesis protein
MEADLEFGIIGTIGAFAAGVLSFLSPCVFPLIPAYLAQLTGFSFDELQGEQSSEQRRKLMVNAVSFVAGLSIVFVFLGASATLAGRFFLNNQVLISRIAGVIIVVFGLHMLGAIHIRFLQREARADVARGRNQAAGPAGSALMGGAFGIGWTPCIGPVLASILVVASQADTVLEGMVLLLAYALGLGVPFIFMAWLLNRAVGRSAITGLRRYMPQLTVASGALLVAMGLLVFSGNLIQLSNWITENFGTGLTI